MKIPLWLWMVAGILLWTAVCLAQTGPFPAATGAHKSPEGGIASFEECVAAGNAVTKSLPPQCRTPEGRIFVGPAPELDILPPESEAACKDLCGDGVCQEMVCMALGCPCAETPASCPADCK